MSSLFASIELAAQVEAAEVSLVSSSTEAGSQRRAGGNSYVQRIGSGVACYAAPNSPFNKVAGVGFGSSVSESDLDQLEEAMGSRQVPVQFELSTLADPEVGSMLTARGYRLVGFENVLGRELKELKTDPTDIGIEPVEPAAMDAWIDMIVTGFEHPDGQGVASQESFPREALVRDIGDMASIDQFRMFNARLDGEVAGGGSMRLHDGVALLCGAATLPDYRRRGVQTALLQSRLQLAAEAGCHLAAMTTQPGSKSHQNAQRQGFDLLYSRAVLIRSS